MQAASLQEYGSGREVRTHCAASAPRERQESSASSHTQGPPLPPLAHTSRSRWVEGKVDTNGTHPPCSRKPARVGTRVAAFRAAGSAPSPAAGAAALQASARMSYTLASPMTCRRARAGRWTTCSAPGAGWAATVRCAGCSLQTVRVRVLAHAARRCAADLNAAQDGEKRGGEGGSACYVPCRAAEHLALCAPLAARMRERASGSAPPPLPCSPRAPPRRSPGPCSTRLQGAGQG